MSKSTIPGIYGYARGRVGAVVYSTSTSSLKGGRQQIVRIRPTTVRNPNTLGQILQRMKLGPAQKFYNAFEEAVENGIMSHSWEGVEYGNKSRLTFIQKALQGDPKVYVPKGITGLVPGQYQVSEGSLPSVNITEETIIGAESMNLAKGEVLNAERLTRLTADSNIAIGDQITILAIRQVNGVYQPVVSRLVVKIDAVVEGPDDTDAVGWYPNDTFYFAPVEYAAGAVIISRGTDTATAQRSTAVMQLFGDYKNLLSPEAMEAAIASYREGVEYNSFNSDWYLNNGSSQAFNGRVQMLDVIVEGNDELETDDSFLVGLQQSDGALSVTIFTANGEAVGQVYAVGNDNVARPAKFSDEAGTAVKGSDLQAALIKMGMRVSGFVELTDAMAAQGGFSVED